MNLKRVGIIVAAIAGVLASVEAATGSLSGVVGGVKELTNLASVSYVDGKMLELVGQFEPLQKKLDVLSNIVADQAVLQLQDKLDTLTAKAIAKQELIEAWPEGVKGLQDLKEEKAALDEQIRQTRSDLTASRCARLKLAIDDIDCQSRF